MVQLFNHKGLPRLAARRLQSVQPARVTHWHLFPKTALGSWVLAWQLDAHLSAQLVSFPDCRFDPTRKVRGSWLLLSLLSAPCLAESPVRGSLKQEFYIVKNRNRDGRSSKQMRRWFFDTDVVNRRPRRTRLPRMEQLESRSLLAIATSFGGGLLTFNSDAAGDKLVLRSTGSASTVEYDDGTGLGFVSQASVTLITFNGNAGDDQLVVFNAAGNVIGAPIAFHGGGDTDTLTTGGGSASIAAAYTPSGPNSGTLSYVGAATETITFDGAESLFDEKTATSLNINAGAGNDTTNIVNGPISPVVTVDEGGPVIVDGSDRDEHGSVSGGVNQGGWQFIQQSLQYLNANACLAPAPCSGTVFAPANRILVVGATPGEATNAVTSAAQIGLGVTPTFVSGVAISAVDFSQYKIVYVPTDADDLVDGSGITNADLNRLFTRRTDIKNFVRGGGGLMALTEAAAQFDASPVTPFNWLQLPANFGISNYDATGKGGPGCILGVNPDCLYGAPALAAAGFTISRCPYTVPVSGSCPSETATAATWVVAWVDWPDSAPSSASEDGTTAATSCAQSVPHTEVTAGTADSTVACTWRSAAARSGWPRTRLCGPCRTSRGPKSHGPSQLAPPACASAPSPAMTT